MVDIAKQTIGNLIQGLFTPEELDRESSMESIRAKSLVGLCVILMVETTFFLTFACGHKKG